MITLNHKFEQYARCYFGGGKPKVPPPPAPPVPPSKSEANTVGMQSKQYDPKKGRASTILSDFGQRSAPAGGKTLLGQ